MKDPIFTKEAVEKILAGQEEVGQKVDALFSLYNEDLNGLKMNRDDLKKEKEAAEAKVAELTATNAKSAEDFAKLQKQLEARNLLVIMEQYLFTDYLRYKETGGLIGQLVLLKVRRTLGNQFIDTLKDGLHTE